MGGWGGWWHAQQWTAKPLVQYSSRLAASRALQYLGDQAVRAVHQPRLAVAARGQRPGAAHRGAHAPVCMAGAEKQCLG